MHILQEPLLREKKILVIDRSPKTSNDRTWCFWEKKPGIFENIVHHHWDALQFFSNTYSRSFPISPYQYKMIRGIDLYEKVKAATEQHPTINWHYAKVTKIESLTDKAVVHTETDIFTAEYVFNSIPFQDVYEKREDSYLLKQHFMGWLIETATPCFDTGVARFMDFRVGQEKGTTFMYVLPVSPTRALVEYTLFTETLLAPSEYEAALKTYIDQYFPGIPFTLVHTEFGVIPMTNRSFPLQEGRVIYTGVAGGQAKGSTGFAFKFIQKRARLITGYLKKNQPVLLKNTWRDRKFRFYDAILLHILYHRKLDGASIFTDLFKKNPPYRILRFLDNETNLWEDMLIMRTLPTKIFLKAAIRELFR